MGSEPHAIEGATAAASSSLSRILIGTAAGIRLPGADGTDPLDGAAVNALAADGQTVWALVDGCALFRVDGGLAMRLAELDGPPGMSLLAGAGSVWVGTREAGLYRLEAEGLARVEAFDDAPTRLHWYHPGGRAGTWTMAADGATLYVNVHVGGILRSDDGEGNWTPIIDMHDDVHQVAVGSDGRLWAGTGIKALAESRDRGASWTYHDRGLHARYMTCAVPAGDGVLVAASSGHAAGDSAIYRFDGARFARCAGLPEPLAPQPYAGRLAANGALAAFVHADGRLFLSEDAGRSWRLAAEDLPDARCVLIR